MSKKEKYFSAYKKAYDKQGEVHYVTVVAEIKNFKKRVDKDIELSGEVSGYGKLTNSQATLHLEVPTRKVTFSYAICSPCDKFSEEKGIKIATSRIKRNETIGSLETSELFSLGYSEVSALIKAKLDAISESIDKIIDD